MSIRNFILTLLRGERPPPATQEERGVTELLVPYLDDHNRYFATLKGDEKGIQIQKLTHILFTPPPQVEGDIWKALPVEGAPWIQNREEALGRVGVQKTYFGIEIVQAYVVALDPRWMRRYKRVPSFYDVVLRHAIRTDRPLGRYIYRDADLVVGFLYDFSTLTTQLYLDSITRYIPNCRENMKKVLMALSYTLESTKCDHVSKVLRRRVGHLARHYGEKNKARKIKVNSNELKLALIIEQKMLWIVDWVETTQARVHAPPPPAIDILPPGGRFPGGATYRSSRSDFTQRQSRVDVADRIRSGTTQEQVDVLLRELDIRQKFKSLDETIAYLHDYATQL